MQIGELVWVRDPQPRVSTSCWGLIVDELVVYLTDESVMVSYEILADSKVFQVDSSDLIRFHYYNRHLINGMDT
ncbi:MAG: hypothetical protein CBD74_02315 [Saprospirales bacterium TMED214]|nr:MAG: hypothetical protein CBD74_02315 [Saprospirales bacterium TMED214]